MFKDYSQPEVFRPERYMEDKDLLDPREIVFGFGRRKCPGKYFADTSAWLVAASIIATLRIAKTKDEDGCVVSPAVEFTTGITRYVILKSVVLFQVGVLTYPRDVLCLLSARFRPVLIERLMQFVARRS